MRRTQRFAGRLLAIAAIAATAVATTGLVFATGAGTATAPEPAQLNDDLTGTWQYATWMGGPTCNAAECDGQTYGFYLSASWMTHSWMGAYAGYPCIDYHAPAGTALTGVVINYPGSDWVRCQMPY